MKIIFAGTPEFALPALKALLTTPHLQICAIYTQPDRPAGRGQKLTASPVKQFVLANNLHLPIYQPENLREVSEQEKIKQFTADVLIDVAYGIILPEEILRTPRFGCINIHPSLLPRWRGAAPIQRAILAGDEKTGVTIMQMDNGLDTGEIIKQAAMPIEQTDTTAILHPKLAELGAQLLLKTLDELQHTGKVNVTSQDNTNSTYAKKLSKEEAKIDWQQSAAQIDRMIRAFNPWPVAYSKIDGETVRIWQACTLVMPTTTTPGTIIHSDKSGIDVATGDGILRIEKLQLAGGKILTAQNILNAKQKMFAVGKKFSH